LKVIPATGNDLVADISKNSVDLSAIIIATIGSHDD